MHYIDGLWQTARVDFTIVQAASPEEFLERTKTFRDAHLMETNILASVAISISHGNKSYSDYFWWIVLEQDEIVGIAIRTVPNRMLVSPMSMMAARQLAKAVADSDPDFWGVTGPEEVAIELMDSWCGFTGRDSGDYPIGMRETTYLLGQHTPLAGVQGAARLADEGHLELLMKWMPAFAEEVGVFRTGPPSEEELLRRIRATPFVIWEVKGSPVAMSGHSPVVVGANARIGRIGPVYTEPAERGHGYGAAVTSAMIDHLNSLGCSTIMLYADSNYEKSNRVYLGLGFRPVGAIVEIGVAPGTRVPQ